MAVPKLPKYYLIKEGILEYAGRNGLRPGDLIPSENELAVMYGVTKMTASRALNELVKEGVVYRVRGKGTFISSLDSVETPEIIIYFPYKEMDVIFFELLIRGMVEAIHQGGYHPILRYVGEEEKFIPGREVSTASAFIVIAGCINQGIREDAIRDLKIPVIYCGYHPETNVSHVYADNEGGMDMALRHLTDLGHRKVFYIKSKDEHISFNRSFNAFKRIADRRELDYKIFYSPNFDAKDGYDLAMEMIDSGDIPTAIMCTNDLVALGVIKAVRHHKLRVPEDISVMGFGNFSSSEFSRPGITTIDINTTIVGQETGALAVKFARSGTLPEREQVCVPLNLVVRESTGPAKA